MARVLSLVLIGVLAGLIPCAYASPPDPTWIGGMWDDADYDDVVLTAASTDSLVEADVLVAVCPLSPSAWPIAPAVPAGVGAAPPSVPQPRAPPTA